MSRKGGSNKVTDGTSDIADSLPFCQIVDLVAPTVQTTTANTPTLQPSTKRDTLPTGPRYIHTVPEVESWSHEQLVTFLSHELGLKPDSSELEFLTNSPIDGKWFANPGIETLSELTERISPRFRHRTKTLWKEI